VPSSVREASLLDIENRRYLVTSNYEALLAYNCAHSYALSVALLADRL
jgi:membrane-bound lytic murein transglycosylase B